MFSYRTLTVRLALAVGLALTGLGVAPAPAATAAGNPDLGPNVMVFDPTMPTSDIQAAVDSIYAQQVNNEMGSLRYALLFKPGSYGTTANPLIVRVGYYTEGAGLGRTSPSTSWAGPTAGRPATSGPHRRRRRCAG